jgi:hypothetical protein
MSSSIAFCLLFPYVLAPDYSIALFLLVLLKLCCQLRDSVALAYDTNLVFNSHDNTCTAPLTATNSLWVVTSDLLQRFVQCGTPFAKYMNSG